MCRRLPLRRLWLAGLLVMPACASVPPAGPVLARGPLNGRLEEGLYHDRLDWFMVATPIPPQDPGYSSLSVTEQYAPNTDYVSFIPIKDGGQYYRAYVEDFYGGNHPVPSMDEIADSAMRFFGRQLVEARAEPLRLVEEKPWAAGPTSGLLRLYTQRAPTTALTDNVLGLAEDYTAYILMYVTSRQGKVAVLWSEWPVGCSLCTPPPPGPPATNDDAIDQALAANSRTAPFFASFRYGDSKNN